MGKSLNSKRKCHSKFRCKRMACSSCRNFRRRYFVDAGALFASRQGPLVHIIVNWKGDYWRSEADETWETLLGAGADLSKALSPHIDFYIRTLGIGEIAHNPHIHFLVRKKQQKIFRKVLSRLSLKYCGMSLRVIKVRSPFRLLGYFFDKNFLPTFEMHGRPKRLRILSGSRGISYGFPTRKHLRDLEGGLDKAKNNAAYDIRFPSTLSSSQPKMLSIRNKGTTEQKISGTPPYAIPPCMFTQQAISRSLHAL